MGRVARALKVDTAFTASSNEEISFSEAGLYLIQKDTSTADGYAFRVQNDYPRLAKVESLADPLIYVCSKERHDLIKRIYHISTGPDMVFGGINDILFHHPEGLEFRVERCRLRRSHHYIHTSL